MHHSNIARKLVVATTTATVFGSLMIMPTSHSFTPLQTPAGRISHQLTGRDCGSACLKTLYSVSRLAAAPNERLDEALEGNDLRKAVSILTENPDIELNKPRWNAIFSAIEEATANAEENTENIRQAAEFPIESETRAAMTKMYDTLKRGGHLRLYGAVDTKMPLAAGSHTLPPPLLESILDMPMKALTPKPTNSLLIAGVVVAILEGIISSTTGISLNFLTFATLLFFVADRLFLNGALSETVLKAFQPGVQNKILRHEAGHVSRRISAYFEMKMMA